MSLNSKQKKQLRGFAQRLPAGMKLGHSGLSEGFSAQLLDLLQRDELVKVKFTGRLEEKDELTQSILEKTGAELVGKVGHTIVLFLEREDPTESLLSEL